MSLITKSDVYGNDSILNKARVEKPVVSASGNLTPDDLQDTNAPIKTILIGVGILVAVRLIFEFATEV